jgi:hypothetical protein
MFAFDDFCPQAGGSMHRGELAGLVSVERDPSRQRKKRIGARLAG